MRRSVVGIVLLTLVFFSSASVAAQESSDATPATNGLPPGVALSTLATGEVGPLPQAPAWVGLARFTYSPGAQATEQIAPGPILFVVETGEITFELGGDQAAEAATPEGESPALGPGEQFSVPANASYSSRNDGEGPATALRVVTFPSAPQITPVTGVTYQLLTGGIAESLPSDTAQVTVARVSLATGADVSTRAEGSDGPILVFVESGSMSLSVPGAEAVLAPGGTALIQGGTEATAHNAGIRPTVVLVVSFSSVPAQDEDGTPEA